ncbi:hypothetical protein EQ845_02730 [Pseudomonas putida]|nr:hypothetical protein EQ845_02730 [Pseudomonas putida]
MSTPIRCRSGFTREYGSGGNRERRVEIGQQARPFRGRTRAYGRPRRPFNVCTRQLSLNRLISPGFSGHAARLAVRGNSPARAALP